MTQRLATMPAPGGVAEVLRIAWPLILGNAFWTLQITVDRVLLSRHSADENGAALAAALYFWTPLILFQNTVSYATSFIAQFRGAGQPRRVGAAFWQSVWLTLTFSMIFLCLHPFADAIVAWGGHAPHQQVLEADYFRCLCFAAPAFLLMAALTGFFAGLGRSVPVMALNAIGLALNIVLDYALIFGHWDAPEMGIEGAGVATAVSTGIASLLGLLFVWQRTYRGEYATLAAWRPDFALLGRLLRFGLPTGVLGVLEAGAFTLFLAFVGRLGPVELNATSVACTLNLLAYLPIMGVAQAAGVLVSQRLGEDDPALAVRSVASGIRLALGLTAMIAIFYLLIPDTLIAAFQSQDNSENWEETAALSRSLLLFVVAYCLFDSASLVLSFSLRGAGDTVFVSLAMLFVSLPLMAGPAWLATRGHGDVHSAWLGVSCYPVVCAAIFAWRMRQGKWRAMRLVESRAAAVDESVPVETTPEKAVL